MTCFRPVLKSPYAMTETPPHELVNAKVSAGVQAENGEAEILNYDALIDRCLGNLELAGRLVEKLQTCLPQEIENVEQALALKDAEQVARIAHRLKGATANVSARGLNQVLEEIEKFGNLGVLSEIPASMERLHQEWERFKKYSITILPPR
jgi:HPt (histidine-containing phosphotransfer) domain-containing protein